MTALQKSDGQMGHTEGPWTLTHIDGSNFAVQRFEVRGMFAGKPNVYPVFNRDTSCIEGGTICASPEDARLIAAAPELLAALQEIVTILRHNPDASEPPRYRNARCSKIAAAAITKATGQ